jgi:hypothetical protein
VLALETTLLAITEAARLSVLTQQRAAVVEAAHSPVARQEIAVVQVVAVNQVVTAQTVARVTRRQHLQAKEITVAVLLLLAALTLLVVVAVRVQLEVLLPQIHLLVAQAALALQALSTAHLPTTPVVVEVVLGELLEQVEMEVAVLA